MLPNEEFALACRAYYEEQGLIVDKTNGEFAHCPQPERYGNSGYYLLHEHHQQQGILQSKDVGEICFWVGHAKQWLLNCDPIPDNYFELWDIYEHFVTEWARRTGRIHGPIGGAAGHVNRDEEGKSVRAVAHMTKLNEEKDEFGRSLNAVKAAEKANSVKNDRGKSIGPVKGMSKTNSQLWESTIDGFRSNSGNVARHNKSLGEDPKARVRVM